MSERERQTQVRLGIAIGPHTVWATRVRRFNAASDLAPSTAVQIEDVTRRSLEQAFETVRDELGVEGAVIDVALVPPLVQARRVQLPRLGLDEARRVLAHAAGKYFFGARAEHVVGVRRIGSARRSPMSVLALAAPTQLIDAVLAAAAHLGWRVDAVLSAYDVWARAIQESLPKGQRPTWLVHATADFTEGIALEDGKPVLVRRSVGGAVGPATVAHWVNDEGEGDSPTTPVCVAVIGDGVAARAGLSELARANVQTVELSGDDTLEPGRLAATFVERTTSPEMIPNAIRETRVRRARRLTMGLGVVAAVVIAIAASAELWGARRELNTLERERNAIRADVEAALQDRDVLLELNNRLTALGTAETTAPRWSRVLATVAENLPTDAHLLAFRASADSLVLEGLADRAAGVFEAMQAAPDIVGVRARAPIRRELLSGNRAIERFALGAQLTRAIQREGPQ